jgi:hypothetical protein
MREDHPIDQLVVLVEGEASTSIASSVGVAARELADQRQWTVAPPGLVDETGVGGGRVVGLVLSIFRALPPWDEELDQDVDRANLEEVKRLVEKVCRISSEHEVTFTVEFAGELAGLIEAGHMDDGIATGLIGEWERTLNARE